MTSADPIPTGFQQGDAVILVSGTYQGTRGVFLHLRADPKWADIEESSGRIRSHPLAWLGHSAATVVV